jgi:hypothetical protein
MIDYITKTTTKLKHTHTKRFGGWITYGKLIISATTNDLFKSLSLYKKIHTIISFIIIGFFKSFLCFFKIVEKYNGIYTITGSEINTDNLIKSFTIYFLFIPIWSWKRKATEKDLLKRKIIDN